MDIKAFFVYVKVFLEKFLPHLFVAKLSHSVIYALQCALLPNQFIK